MADFHSELAGPSLTFPAPTGHLRRPDAAPLLIHVNKGLSCWNAAAAVCLANERLERDLGTSEGGAQVQLALSPSVKEGVDPSKRKMMFMEWKVLVVQAAAKSEKKPDVATAAVVSTPAAAAAEPAGAAEPAAAEPVAAEVAVAV